MCTCLFAVERVVCVLTPFIIDLRARMVFVSSGGPSPCACASVSSMPSGDCRSHPSRRGGRRYNRVSRFSFFISGLRSYGFRSPPRSPTTHRLSHRHLYTTRRHLTLSTTHCNECFPSQLSGISTFFSLMIYARHILHLYRYVLYLGSHTHCNARTHSRNPAIPSSTSLYIYPFASIVTRSASYVVACVPFILLLHRHRTNTRLVLLPSHHFYLYLLSMHARSSRRRNPT